MSAANRRRGQRAEVAVVNFLRASGWPDARRYLAGDGRQPGDIDAWPGISIEVKDRARSAWPSWCAQAVEEAGGRIPVVVRRTRGVPDVGQWETRLPVSGYVHLTDGPAALWDWQVKACPRTGLLWVVTTFAALCELVKEETNA